MADKNKEKFSLIYDQYIDKIYRFVYIKVSSREVAQDVTSKVFLRTWESVQKGKDIKNEGAFLYQIARNMVVDHYRERGKKKEISMEYVKEVSDPRTSPYENAVLSREIESVKRVIQKIKKEYQDVIIWYYLEDMPAEQIAKILHKPVGTVRVMIHRGLEYIKDGFKDTIHEL